MDTVGQEGVKPGGSVWKPGGVWNDDGHRKGSQGKPCVVQEDAMEGRTGRGNAEVPVIDIGALSDVPISPSAKPVTDETGT